MSPWTVWMENLARGLAEVAMPGLMAQSSLEKYLLAGIDRVHASVAKAQKPAERAKALAKGLAMPSALMLPPPWRPWSSWSGSCRLRLSRRRPG